MRQEHTIQASLFDLFAYHEMGRELKAMSGWLDEHPELAGLVARDLRRHGVKDTVPPWLISGLGVALRAPQAAAPHRTPPRLA